MAHRTLKKSSYDNLIDRLNRFPQGAPPSETLYQILKVLFSEREAELVSLLPIRPFTAEKAARNWKMDLNQASKILHELAGRAILVDMEKEGISRYVLPPPMAGFFEFSLMRLNGKIDQKLLGELFHQYLNVEEDFIRDLFVQGETQLGRIFVNEAVLSEDNALHVLDYERASEVIRTASHIGVGICYCRHKMEHMGKNCDAPMDICMTFNNSAASLTKHGYARKIDAMECLDLLDQAYSHNLVQFGENIQQGVNFICNCCSCCCEAMVAARKYGFMQPVHTSNFLPEINRESCSGCGKCVNVCPVEALGLFSASDPRDRKKKTAKVDENICLGCGVCVRVCHHNSISLKGRDKRVITPVDSTHRTVLMAIERGKLQNLIFDNQILFSHRALAALLGVLLKLPPAKQILAQEQVKSRYLARVIRWYNKRNI
ncbi:MAG: 4Fe-4S binding protein [Spirochaetaceae bacterium]|nr:4Fe-4S binding protein [Spirochaetaceae bacterium]